MNEPEFANAIEKNNANYIVELAEAENMMAHALAVKVRK